MYVAHARNLANGHPYSQTGLVYNPDEAILPTYPPGFPLLLAPVYSVMGLNFTALKVPGVLLFVGAIGILSFLAVSWEGPVTAAALAILVGFNPFFTQFKNGILSDLPFLFFFLLALFVSDRALRHSQGRSQDLRFAVALGVAWWAAYVTRTVGIVLPIAFAITAVTHRERRRALVVSLAVFFLLAAGQAFLLHGPSDYLVRFSLTPENVSDNINLYLDDVKDLLDPRLGASVVRIALAASGALAIAGMFRLWKKGARLPVVTFLLYTATAIAWPFHEGPRMLIPVIPLGFLFAIAGFRALCGALRPATPALAAVVTACVLVTYGRQYYEIATQAPIPGADSPDARSLFAYVRSSTPRCAVLLFKKPRALALYTGRQAAIYSTHALDAPWSSVSRLRATHLIVVRSSTQDAVFLKGLERQRPGAVTELFANTRFALYDLGVTPRVIRRQAAVPECNEARPQEQPRLVGSSERDPRTANRRRPE